MQFAQAGWNLSHPLLIFVLYMVISDYGRLSFDFV